MPEASLRRAITGPAEASGLRVESALIDAIVADARADGASLPMFSQALALTWENREDGRLTRAGYDRAGRVAGAIEAGAEAVYAGLTEDQRAAARDVLRQMTAVGHDGRLARRPVSRAARRRAGRARARRRGTRRVRAGPAGGPGRRHGGDRARRAAAGLATAAGLAGGGPVQPDPLRPARRGHRAVAPGRQGFLAALPRGPARRGPGGHARLGGRSGPVPGAARGRGRVPPGERPGWHPAPVGPPHAGRRPGPGAPRRPGRGGARGPVGPGRRQPAAHRGDVGAARRAEHDAGRHQPGHRVAARRGRVADRADRAGTLQPARVAGPAGARHPGRPFGRGDRGRLRSGRQDPGGRLPGRHDPALGHRLSPPDQHRDLGRRGGRARVHQRRQDPGGSRADGRRGVEPGRPGQVRQASAGRRDQRPVRRVQPGRHQAGHRWRRREHPAVGRGHRAGNRRADELRPHAGGGRGVRPRRVDGGRGQQRRNGPAVGRDHPA